MNEKNIVRNLDHLKKIVNEEVGSVVNNDKIDVQFS